MNERPKVKKKGAKQKSEFDFSAAKEKTRQGKNSGTKNGKKASKVF